MDFRRTLSTVLIATLLSATIPAQPVLAVSTSREIQMGQQDDKQIVEQYGVLNDPLMNRWVQGVGGKLWDQVARKDVPYNIKILDTSDVNAFSTLGGYVYINAGTLDFVQSDDELAGVIGHETGHIERRHGVTYPAKAQALDILFGLASLFSPVIYRFGQLAEAGILAKASRTQETQADQYGLLLMSRAGYDPDAMVSFMRHLGAAHDKHEDIVDKYLADHPGFSDRVSHLVGYPELDPTKRTNDQILVQALHDWETARYNVAAAKLQSVLSKDPNDALALLRLGQTQIALGLPNKAEQTLMQAAAKGSPTTRAAALATIERYRDSPRPPFTRVDADALRAQLTDALRRHAQTAALLAQRRDPAKDQLKAVDARLQGVSREVPDLSGIDARNTRAAAVLKNLLDMGRSIDTAFDKPKEVINGVGADEKNRTTGLLEENASILRELQAPLLMHPIPPASASLLPSYPTLLTDVDLASGDMIRAIDASRSALALLDVGLSDVDDFLNHLSRIRSDFGGDITQGDYDALVPFMAKAGVSLNKAAIAGSQAWQLYNLARCRQLQSRITMLQLASSESRYASLQEALRQRTKSSGIDYRALLAENLTPGEVSAATIIAADTGTTPEAIVQEAKNNRRRIIDLANSRSMSAFSLEIFLGLIYLDYTDDPEKEARQTPPQPDLAPPSLH